MNSTTHPADPRSLLADLRQPVDGSALAVFRMLLAALVLLYLSLDIVNVLPTLIRQPIRFTYPGFDWIPLWPDNLMYVHYGVLAALALCVGAGLFYRAASVLLAIGYAYAFLLEPTYYSNNTYFLLLALVLLCLLPAHRVWSLDARRAGPAADPTVPRWAPLSIAVLTAVPLVYMGLTRLNADWLNGYPLRIWFRLLAPQHYLGDSASALLYSKEFALAWSYLGLLAHLAIVPLLLWRRPARWAGIGLLVLYYAGISLAYGRFIFPLTLAIGLVMFFPHDWPRRALAWLRKSGSAVPAAIASPATPGALTAGGKWQMAAVGGLLAFHALFPARALLYPGPAAWSGDGYRFSWRTMLDDKHCEAEFSVREPATDKTWNVNPREQLRPAQVREMTVRPDLMLQFARRTAQRWAVERQVQDPEVHARAKCSLNSRPYGPLFDHRLDLSKLETSVLGATGWVAPLDMGMHRGWRVVGPGK